MQATSRYAARYDAGTLRMLEASCGAIDRFRTDYTPALLKQIQDAIRGQIANCEELSSTLDARRKRAGHQPWQERQKRLGRRLERKRDLRRLMAGHYDSLRARDTVVQRRRSAF